MWRQTAPIDGAGGGRAAEQRERGRRRAGRAVAVVDPMIAARRAQMLAQELPRLRIDQPHVQVVPLHVDPLADPAWRRAVERGLDLDAAIEMDRAVAKAVIAKRLDGAAAGARVAPRQTSRRLGASSCHECACRPSARPSDRDRLARPRASRSAGPAAASAACGRCRIRLCPFRSGSPTRHGNATAP